MTVPSLVFPCLAWSPGQDLSSISIRADDFTAVS